MIQQINLYRSEFSNTTALPNFRHAMLACLVIAVLVIAIFLWQLFRVGQINAQLADVEAETIEVMTTISNISPRDSDNQLQTIDQTISTLKSKLTQLREITAMLSGQYGGGDKQPGFSSQLDGLVRQHLSGISLSQIKLMEAGKRIELQGTAILPEVVPRYLAALQTDPAFKGADFGQLNLQRDSESLQLVFKLQHNPEDQNGQGRQP